MGRLIAGLIIGLLLGGVLTFLVFVGTPRAGKVPGEIVKPPDAPMPVGTAQIVLRPEFFNGILTTMFQQMNSPVYQLGPQGMSGGECSSQITVQPQGSGVNTGVTFENNQLGAQLAFNGNYASPVGCLNFSGWANANFQLRYDHASNNVYGQLNVETVNLDGVNPIWSALITPFVQSSLNTRVNPIPILNGNQMAVNLPIAAANGNLQARIADVRGEVRDNTLNLYVVYNFSGTKNQ
jgi:hypothetical protein